MDFLRRKKRLVLGLAAGAASAAAVYYWWSGYTNTRLQQQRSVARELSAILDGAAAEGEGDPDADDCGSPDLDDSLDSHFNYIQKVSAPQELSGLLPRIKDTLFRLTDVALVKQQRQQQLGAAGPGGGGVQEQLRLLACLCFGRTVAAAVLLPLMDLCVRTKLNIIGRHLFLQEKFSKLRQPAAPAARMRLPPRLTAAAAEAFLSCEQLSERGSAWLVEQAMFAAESLLERVPMDTAVTPEDLAEMVQAVAASLGQAVNAAAATSPTGNAWVDAVVGPNTAAAVGVDAAAAAGSAEAYRRALANAAMVEELEAELRQVLCNYRFSEALQAAVDQCLCTCAAHIHATFISQAAAAQALSPRPSPPPPQPRAPAPDPTSAAPGQDPPLPPFQEQQQPSEPQRVVSPFTSASTEGSAAGTCGEAALTSAGAAAAVACQSAAVVVDPATQQNREGSGGGNGSARAALAAAAVAAMQPRPLARCLKAVQGACEPLFVDAREVSARIASLPPVMSLCAVAFAAPLEL